ncbi:hypothetical protein HMPREF0496_1742 [Lentilactobacillus hilgardii ATCC 27305]|jgi:hypothetical protein|nr:hypothetical protein HMPREF0496_1742 [Lentilactobacillus hilgardii ATCC 27305]
MTDNALLMRNFERMVLDFLSMYPAENLDTFFVTLIKIFSNGF